MPEHDIQKAVPFLSVVMRTQGRRPFSLEESLTGLLAQTVDDFEILVMAHNVDEAAFGEITQLVNDFPEEFSERTRVLPVNGGGRSAPLNAGFSEARGRYIAMLDDDDIPFAHWVETFRTVSEGHPGNVVRANVADQASSVATVHGLPGVVADHGFVFPRPTEYRLAEHLVENQTPNMAVAIPREFFHDQGARFDDTLTTHEDWEFITRAVSACGVASSPEYTALYRWWGTEESSRTVQSDEDRERNIAEVHHRHDTAGVFFPGSEVVKLRATLEEKASLQNRLRESLATEKVIRAEWARGLEDMKAHYVKELEQADRRVQLLTEIHLMLGSRRWRMTAPLRWISRLATGRREIRLIDCFGMSNYGLLTVIEGIGRSTSWRLGTALASTARKVLSRTL